MIATLMKYNIYDREEYNKAGSYGIYQENITPTTEKIITKASSY